METPPNPRVTCPSCGHSYQWQDALVGRVANCKSCGGQFVVPDAPGVGLTAGPDPAPSKPDPKTAPKPDPQPEPKPAAPADDDGLYELDMDSLDELEQKASAAAAASAAPGAGTGTSQAAAGGNCPQCNSPLKEDAVLCINCGFNTAEGRPVETELDENDPPSSLPPQSSEPQGYDPTPADHLSEAEKARRREEQRLAANANAKAGWTENKTPLIVAGAVLVFLAIAFTMYYFATKG